MVGQMFHSAALAGFKYSTISRGMTSGKLVNLSKLQFGHYRRGLMTLLWSCCEKLSQVFSGSACHIVNQPLSSYVPPPGRGWLCAKLPNPRAPVPFPSSPLPPHSFLANFPFFWFHLKYHFLGRAFPDTSALSYSFLKYHPEFFLHCYHSLQFAIFVNVFLFFLFLFMNCAPHLALLSAVSSVPTVV